MSDCMNPVVKLVVVLGLFTLAALCAWLVWMLDTPTVEHSGSAAWRQAVEVREKSQVEFMQIALDMQSGDQSEEELEPKFRRLEAAKRRLEATERYLQAQGHPFYEKPRRGTR